VQYTFVRAYVRSAVKDDFRARYRHGYSAVKTLDTILGMLGL
jgi:hypothetical protein